LLKPDGPTRPPHFLAGYVGQVAYEWRVQNLNPPHQNRRAKRASLTGPTRFAIPSGWYTLFYIIVPLSGIHGWLVFNMGN